MAEQNPDLLKQADELKIKIDGRWSDERIQQEIDKALSDAPHERAGTAPDAGAPAYELQGREPFGGKGDHDGNGKAGGAAAPRIPVHVNRDYWDANGVRTRKGSIVEVTVEEALDGVESGALSRVK